jgi:hypothetical protein
VFGFLSLLDLADLQKVRVINDETNPNTDNTRFFANQQDQASTSPPQPMSNWFNSNSFNYQTFNTPSKAIKSIKTEETASCKSEL